MHIANVMVICHAPEPDRGMLLIGRARCWGKDRAFDTSKFFVICCNVLGSPYGTASPLTINPVTGKLYGPDFPLVTVRDDIR